MAFPKTQRVEREATYPDTSRVKTKLYGPGTVVSTTILKATGDEVYEYVTVKIDNEHHREFLVQSLEPL